MSENDTTAKESTDIEPRTRRALERVYSVLHTDGTPIEEGDSPTVVSVVSGNSGRQHTVDVREDRCTCEDHEFRGVECAHIRRARFALGHVPVHRDTLAACDVHDRFAEHAPGPAVVASDGGIIDAGDDGEVLDESSDEGDSDGRPADCDCAPSFKELPCWPCYRDGFEEPNPNASDDEESDDGREDPTRSEPADFGHGESTGVQEL